MGIKSSKGDSDENEDSGIYDPRLIYYDDEGNLRYGGSKVIKIEIFAKLFVIMLITGRSNRGDREIELKRVILSDDAVEEVIYCGI